ncbi:MAG: hydrolase [Planctomycetota bacterium]
MLTPETALLNVIDVQGRLAHIVAGSEGMRANVVRLVEGARLFDLPVVATEQVPDKLGDTVPEVAAALGDVPRLVKDTFSCWPEESIRAAYEGAGRSQVLVCGIESHVCVYQTCLDLLSNGWEVHLVVDAIASRSEDNKAVAVRRLEREGALLTTTEMALFELQHDCRGDRFRALARLVK